MGNIEKPRKQAAGERMDEKLRTQGAREARVPRILVPQQAEPMAEPSLQRQLRARAQVRTVCDSGVLGPGQLGSMTQHLQRGPTRPALSTARLQ